MQHTIYLFDGFQLDAYQRRLSTSGGLVLTLNSRAMDTLLLLVGNAGQVVDKRRIMQAVWPDTVVEDNNLNQCIAAIRKVLGETAGSNRFVMTVPGRGYSFVCPVHSTSREAVPAPAARSRPLAGAVLLWITCIAALATLLVQSKRSERDSDRQAAAVATPETSDTMTLGLRPIDRAAGAAASQFPLTRCLLRKKGTRVRMQLQLLPPDSDQPFWRGDYTVNPEELLPLAQIDGNTPGCVSPSR